MQNVKIKIELPDNTTRTIISARSEHETANEVGERIAALHNGTLISASLTDDSFTAYTVLATPEDIT